MSTVYQINPAFITQKVGNKIGIFDAEKSVMHTLNDTAAVIFLGLQLQWDKTKIVQKLMSQYKIQKTIATKDVDATLSDMVKKKILLKHSS